MEAKRYILVSFDAFSINLGKTAVLTNVLMVNPILACRKFFIYSIPNWHRTSSVEVAHNLLTISCHTQYEEFLQINLTVPCDCRGGVRVCRLGQIMLQVRLGYVGLGQVSLLQISMLMQVSIIFSRLNMMLFAYGDSIFQWKVTECDTENIALNNFSLVCGEKNQFKKTSKLAQKIKSKCATC